VSGLGGGHHVVMPPLLDVASTPSGPVPEPVFDPGRLDAAFRVVASQVDQGEMPAAALAVAGPRGIVRSEAFGRDGDRRVGVGDRFTIASITKPITAVAVAQLLEEGLLTLGEPVRRIVPEYDPPPGAQGGPGGEAVTAWHLLTHTSGSLDVPGGLGGHIDPSLIEAVGDGPTVEGALGLLGRKPLAFAPGAQYAYTSDTFLVLGEVVRRLRHTSTFGEALDRTVLRPLGMTATGFAPSVESDRSVTLHVSGLPDTAAATLAAAFARLEHPGGGLWSTVGDLVRFGRAMLLGGSLEGARIIGRPWLELMTREHTIGIVEPGTPPRRPGHGLGWAVATPDGRLPGSLRRFGHRGASGSYLSIDPAAGLVIVLLGDLWGAPERLQDTVLGAVYGALA
jgi:CubicO group peptidase (beta-lactamase class C family)